MSFNQFIVVKNSKETQASPSVKCEIRNLLHLIKLEWYSQRFQTSLTNKNVKFNVPPAPKKSI